MTFGLVLLKFFIYTGSKFFTPGMRMSVYLFDISHFNTLL